MESFKRQWQKATTKAGLPALLVHDLRRSAVRNMERLSVPRSVAMKITGHRTESVYRRYAIVSDSDMRAAAQRLSPTPSPSREPVEIPDEVWRILTDESPREGADGINTEYSVRSERVGVLEVAD